MALSLVRRGDNQIESMENSVQSWRHRFVSHHSYASADGKDFVGTSHFLISTTLPIASAEPIATEKRIKNTDRASTLSSIA
jgi:hypothetical protein